MGLKLEIFLLLIILLSVTANDTETIGLLLKARSVTVSSGQTEQQVGLYIPMSHTAADFNQMFTELRTEFAKITNIPALAVTTEYYRIFGSTLVDIQNEMVLIEANLKTITKHRELGVERPQHPKCLVTWVQIKPLTLVEMIKKIKSEVANVKQTATEAEYKTTAADIMQLIEQLQPYMSTLVT